MWPIKEKENRQLLILWPNFIPYRKLYKWVVTVLLLTSTSLGWANLEAKMSFLEEPTSTDERNLTATIFLLRCMTNVLFTKKLNCNEISPFYGDSQFETSQLLWLEHNGSNSPFLERNWNWKQKKESNFF